jgi:hypothetical protein
LSFCLTAACSTAFDDDLTGGVPSACGDGVLQAGEVCDDGLPVTATCASLVGASATGSVRCTGCGFDVRGCSQLVGGSGGDGLAGQGAAGVAGQGQAGGGGAVGGGGLAGASAGTSGAAGAGGLGGAGMAGASGAPAGGASAGGGAAGGGGVSGTGGSSGTSGTGGSSGTGGGGGSGSGAGGSGGSGSGSGAGGSGGGSSGNGGGGAGGGDSCATECGPFRSCVGGQCACPDTSLAVGAGCWPKSPSPPAMRTKEEVCAARSMGNTQLSSGQPTPTAACSPWIPTAADVADNANHYNYLRWLAGLAPVVPSTGSGPGSADQAACAMAASYDGSFVEGGTCVTSAAVASASQSIRYQGTGFDAVYDAILNDDVSPSSLITRRFLLHPNTSVVAWGAFQNPTSGGACVRVPFGAMPPTTYAQVIWPPPGFVPIELAAAPWTVFPAAAAGNLQVKVVRSPPGTSLTVHATAQTDAGTLSPSLQLERVNWVPVVGRSYAVTLDQGDQHVGWTFEPIACE